MVQAHRVRGIIEGSGTVVGPSRSECRSVLKGWSTFALGGMRLGDFVSVRVVDGDEWTWSTVAAFTKVLVKTKHIGALRDVACSSHPS